MIEEKIMHKLIEEIKKGYKYVDENDSVSACKIWESVWKTIIAAMNEGSYDVYIDFETDLLQKLHDSRMWNEQECIYNWSGDYERELGNALLKDISFAQKRIDFCTWYIEKFGDESDIYVIESKMAIAETNFWIGKKAEGEKLFNKHLIENPTCGRGWIAWSDCYWVLARAEDKNGKKAIELLKRALKVDGLEGRIDIQERLKELYSELGMKKEADAIVIDECEDGDGIPLSEIGDYAEISKTVIDSKLNELLGASLKSAGRNAPCPCGSGKKYKKCCGK
jgi:tetratricopeptide (TPR) repeat protein